MKSRFIIICLILFFCDAVFGSEFLKIIPDVRSTGMGCVNNGISRDISALYLNPAGLVSIRNYEISLSHMMWPLTGLDFTPDFFIQYEYFSYARRYGRSALGINLSHYHQPDYEFDNSSYSIYSGFASVSYSRYIYFLQAGIRAKAIWEVLGEFSGKAIGFDAGLMHSFNFLKLYKSSTPNCQIGISAFNLGSSVVLYSEKEPLPASLQIGYGYTIFKNINQTFLFANDYIYYFGYKDMYKSMEINTGLEYSLLNVISLRTGIILPVPVDEPAFVNFNSSQFTVGLGFGNNIFDHRVIFNYSYKKSLALEFYRTHSVSITIQKFRYMEKNIE